MSWAVYPLATADSSLANFFAAHQQPQVVQILLWVTVLGRWEWIVGLAIFASVVSWVWLRRRFILPLWLALAGSLLTVAWGKIVFHRPRPPLAIWLEPSFSFPSGHATLATVGYGYLMYLVGQNSRRWQTRSGALVFGCLTILAVGLSRLYLGLHYLSDVGGGFLLGILWLIFAIRVSQRRAGGRENQELKHFRSLWQF